MDCLPESSVNTLTQSVSVIQWFYFQRIAGSSVRGGRNSGVPLPPPVGKVCGDQGPKGGAPPWRGFARLLPTFLIGSRACHVFSVSGAAQ